MKKILTLSIITVCVTTLAAADLPVPQEIPVAETIATGVASWYGFSSPCIRETTANMEIFDENGLTCAIWGIPFNTLLRVTNLNNGKSVLVRVNDRGPAKRLVARGRVIDLTKGAFEKIGSLKKGLIEVRVEKI